MIESILTSAVFLIAQPLGASPDALGCRIEQSLPNVPVDPDDEDYQKLDKLIAAGLVQTIIVGQRPWSRAEFRRILLEANSRFSKASTKLNAQLQSYLDSVLNELSAKYLSAENCADRTSPHSLFESVRLEETLGNIAPRSILPIENGLGQIRGDIAPLAAYQGGENMISGSHTSLQSEHSAILGPHFSFHLSPRLETNDATQGAPDTAGLKVNTAYAKFSYANLEIEAGRDQLIWGQSPNGGLVLSNNALPLDMIKISSRSPFYHPWIFKYLGPSDYTFFVARMEKDRLLSQSFFYGLKINFRPHPLLELGFYEVIFLGGKGPHSQPVHWTDPVTEFFNARHGFLDPGGDTDSDHRFGAEFRLRIPPLRNTEFYFEGIWDDLAIKTFADNFTHRMGLLTGIFIPLLGNSGRYDLRLEARHIEGMLYRHDQQTSGHVRYRHLLGDELGPDGDSVLGTFHGDIDQHLSLQTSVAYEVRRANTYKILPGEGDNGGEIIRLQGSPEEKRIRVQPQLTWHWRPTLKSILDGGFERVFNFAFVDGRDRNQWLASVRIKKDF